MQLVTAVRGASVHAYTNGQSKNLTIQLVSVIRSFGLCNRHNARLNVYVLICINR